MVLLHSLWKRVWEFKAKKCSHKKLYAHVHSSIIHNSEKVERFRMPINWLMDKQNAS